MHTITVIVPAHNEEEGLPATLESLARQTAPPDRVLVVDDASTDRTGEVAAAHGATVLRPPRNLGSKARAQNHALPHCTTDLVLAVDADTVLAPDYIETVLPVFDDPAVTVAAGTVRTRHTRTIWERGARPRGAGMRRRRSAEPGRAPTRRAGGRSLPPSYAPRRGGYSRPPDAIGLRWGAYCRGSRGRGVPGRCR
ncbi:glycosyltransferase family 2 protein [Streptomyces sp. NPDC059080]|uniref:glycosyltransferase family 2 protein n=1 Tax=Streptomyces sp. NPDC059080 TaxID=3346718 RepID=UPI0036D12A77